MKPSKERLIISIMLVLTMSPTSADAQNAASQRISSDIEPAPDSLEGNSAIIAKMLRSGLNVSWLFEPVLLKRINPSADDAAKAQAVLDLARVAAAQGLDRRPDVLAARQGADAMVLAEAARRTLIDSIVVPDAEVATRIASHPGRYDEYRLSHVFVAVGATPDGGTRDDAAALTLAKRLRLRIAGGENFASVAQSASEDRSTAADGGVLSGLLGVTMNPAFFTQVQTLKAGETTGPVRGPDGYHLIRVDSRRAADVGSARFWVEQDVIDEKLPAMIAQAVAAAKETKASGGGY